jgi:uncharacterized membrane protein YphA (DoxX/SURF4 family)
MKWIDRIFALLVGGLFIFSGLIKVNDPVGTAIKLKEYFEVFAEDFGSFFHAFVPYALPLAVFLVVLEVVLGVALLVNFRAKATVTALLAMIGFFTFLTFYSAYFNKVTDCGCFGDAIKLTPWESFSKDVVLSAMIGWLFIRRRHLANGASLPSLVAVGAASALSLGICWFALEHLPPIDFRPYKIGDNIRDNMQPLGTPDIVYTFMKDGKEVEAREWMKPEDGYTFVGSAVTNEDEIQPKITDYNVTDAEGNDVTEESLSGLKLLVVAEMADKADRASLPAIAQLARELDQANVQTMVLTADAAQLQALLASQSIDLPLYSTDATVLKAMVRANPGLLLLSDGTVKGKWHYNDLPTATEALAKLQ